MNLYEKIRLIYPQLTEEDFAPLTRTIYLQDNSDGNGAFIAKWEHPTLPRPTDEELA
jgi:hypothetical protein